MQKFKDAFGIEVDDDDPWYKEHPGEYKVVGHTSIGEPLYYRPGMNDDDEEEPVYKFHGDTSDDLPHHRQAHRKTHDATQA